MQRTALNALLTLVLVVSSAAPFACSRSAEPDTRAEPSAVVSAEPEPSGEALVGDDSAASAGAAAVASAEATASAGADPAAAPTTTSAPGAEAPKAPATPKPAPPPAERPQPAPEPPKGYTGPDPCLTTNFKFASVRNACAQGGVKQAKAQMKAMVKRAKDDGKDLKCTSCHENTKTYPLKPNAVEDMRALQ